MQYLASIPGCDDDVCFSASKLRCGDTQSGFHDVQVSSTEQEVCCSTGNMSAHFEAVRNLIDSHNITDNDRCLSHRNYLRVPSQQLVSSCCDAIAQDRHAGFLCMQDESQLVACEAFRGSYLNRRLQFIVPNFIECHDSS